MVSIERIGLDDVVEVADIRVTGEQSEFVLPPAEVLTLIGELGLEETGIPYKIVAGGEAVGFFTLNFYSLAVSQYCDGEEDCSLQSFMIDIDQQGKGYGKEAISRIIEHLQRDYPVIKRLKLTVNRRNEVAKALYLKCGFRDTGKEYVGGPSGPQHVYEREV